MKGYAFKIKLAGPLGKFSDHYDFLYNAIKCSSIVNYISLTTWALFTG